jgi:hypothetical protein
MGKLARIMLCTIAALAFAVAASGSAALADTGGPGVTAATSAGR